jgi:hypothetical protein
MNCPRHQLFSGAAFATHQDRGIGRRHPRQKPVDLLHGITFADHVVLQIDFRSQPQVFLFQPQQPPRIFERDGRDAGDAGHQLQMISIKTRDRVGGVQVDAADYSLKYR